MSVYSLGLKVLDILEVVHRAGYIHNDIQLEKIVLAENQIISKNDLKNVNAFDRKSLHIINFSFMTPYIDFKTKKHMKKEKI